MSEVLVQQEDQQIEVQDTPPEDSAQEDVQVSDTGTGSDTEPADDWEYKYKLLENKYNNEVSRLQKTLQRVEKENRSLLERLRMLETIVANQPVQESKQQEEEKITEPEDDDIIKLKEEFPEVYKAVRKLVSSNLENVTKKVSSRIDEVAETTKTQQFYTALSALVPDWEQLNTDPEFLTWLDETEGDTGFTRMQLLRYAFQQGDVNSVANFFNRFKKLRTNPTPPPATENVSPPHRKTSAPTKEPSKKVFKESEIRQFYRDVALGKIPPDKKEKIEREITQAAMEDRILYGQ